MKNGYWNTLNEGGEGYRKVEPTVKSADQIAYEKDDLVRKLAEAEASLGYAQAMGKVFDVATLEHKIASLKTRIG